MRVYAFTEDHKLRYVVADLGQTVYPNESFSPVHPLSTIVSKQTYATGFFSDATALSFASGFFGRSDQFEFNLKIRHLLLAGSDSYDFTYLATKGQQEHDRAVLDYYLDRLGMAKTVDVFAEFWVDQMHPVIRSERIYFAPSLRTSKLINGYDKSARVSTVTASAVVNKFLDKFDKNPYSGILSFMFTEVFDILNTLPKSEHKKFMMALDGAVNKLMHSRFKIVENSK